MSDAERKSIDQSYSNQRKADRRRDEKIRKRWS